MPSCSLSAVLICCSDASSPACGSSTASSSGPLKPGAEALLEQVVGHSRGVVLLVRAGVARRQSHVQSGRGEHEQDHQRADGHRPRPARHEAAPARGEAGLAIGEVAVAAVGRHLDPPADPRAEDRRHERERGDHREQHGQRGADGRAVEERDAEQHHAEHGDHDHDAREQDRAAGRVDRLQRRFSHVAAGAAFEPEAVEDQERVVDADADPDHRRELRRPVDDVEHAGADDRHQAEAHDHREQRIQERQAHRDHAEREEEHDGRHEETEDLAGAARLGRRPVDEVTAELHLDPAWPSSASVFSAIFLIAAGSASPAPLANWICAKVILPSCGYRCALGERVVDGEHLGRLLDLGSHRLDLGSIVEHAALVDGPDDGGGVAGLLREAVLEQVIGPLGLRARKLEVVDEFAGGGTPQHGEREEGGDPEADYGAAPIVAPGGKFAHIGAKLTAPCARSQGYPHPDMRGGLSPAASQPA